MNIQLVSFSIKFKFFNVVLNLSRRSIRLLMSLNKNEHSYCNEKNRKEYVPGRSCPAVNGRTPIIYDEKRRLITVIVYGSHIRSFAVYYAYHKQ
jgi:hypothetical protein